MNESLYQVLTKRSENAKRCGEKIKDTEQNRKDTSINLHSLDSGNLRSVALYRSNAIAVWLRKWSWENSPRKKNEKRKKRTEKRRQANSIFHIQSQLTQRSSEEIVTNAPLHEALIDWFIGHLLEEMNCSSIIPLISTYHRSLQQHLVFVPHWHSQIR